MSEFELNPMFLRMRRSLGDIVIYERDGQLYTRIKGKKGRTPSDAQVQVHQTFSRLTSDWSSVGGIMHEAWYQEGDRKKMNGYNLFIKMNFDSERQGRTIELFRALDSYDAPQLMAAPAGTGEISVGWVPPSGMADGRVHIFLKRRTTDGLSDGTMKRYSPVQGTASPYVIGGLEAGSTYYVYAVLTDGEWATARQVTSSASVIATAGV